MHTTRERILTHLKRYPGAGVDALAQALELAPMTIRQQLTKLRGDGLVEARPERGRTGRPAHAFTLTAAGEEQFPKAYDRLARLLIEALPESGVSDGHGNRGANGSGETSRADLFRQMVVKAAEPHRERLERLQPWERMQEAVAILQDESGFTELDSGPGSPVVREYNCIYQRVAEGHDEVCGFHTEYVSALIGAPVELESCQCHGANACRFRVQV